MFSLSGGCIVVIFHEKLILASVTSAYDCLVYDVVTFTSPKQFPMELNIK